MKDSQLFNALKIPFDIVEAMRKDKVHNFCCKVCGEPVSRRLFPKYEKAGLCPDHYDEAMQTDPERVG